MSMNGGRGQATTALPTPRAHASGVATRERIILAAERLFAERGIAGVSLREVAQAAGQRNNVAIQYHFRDRDGLLVAILHYRGAVTQEHRSRMLADLLGADREPTVRELVSVIVRPLASQLVPGNHNVAFQARVVVERGPMFPVTSRAHWRTSSDMPMRRGGPMASSDAYLLIREALRRRLPDLPEVLFEARWDMTLDTNVLTLATYQMAMARGALQVPLEPLVEDLIDALTGVLTAPFAPGAVAMGEAEGRTARPRARARRT